jgi:hypothetical protein
MRGVCTDKKNLDLLSLERMRRMQYFSSGIICKLFRLRQLKDACCSSGTHVSGRTVAAVAAGGGRDHGRGKVITQKRVFSTCSG